MEIWRIGEALLLLGMAVCLVVIVDGAVSERKRK